MYYGTYLDGSKNGMICKLMVEISYRISDIETEMAFGQN